ncbi:MAG: SDR family oxidoreductase [Planctomycetaceae bacterium]|nr:SDR family oxidoreductase [Planctomycetaceae bacterium]
MPPRLLNRTAVVTGGSRGIGRAVVEQLLQEGARVIAASRSVGQLADLEERSSPRLITHQVDVTQAGELDRLLEFSQRRFRHIDILCPLAGRLFYADYLTLSQASLEENLRLNSISAWQTLQKFLPVMSKLGAACFVTPAALFDQISGLEEFAASKALLRSYIRSSVNLPGVRVNGIQCGPVNTDAWQAEELQRLAKEHGWQWLSPMEVAESILFLVSEEARGIRGTELLLSAPR